MEKESKTMTDEDILEFKKIWEQIRKGQAVWGASFYFKDQPAIDRLLATIEQKDKENASLASWQCPYTDGKTGLVSDEYGNQYCARKANEH